MVEEEDETNKGKGSQVNPEEEEQKRKKKSLVGFKKCFINRTDASIYIICKGKNLNILETVANQLSELSYLNSAHQHT